MLMKDIPVGVDRGAYGTISPRLPLLDCQNLYLGVFTSSYFSVNMIYRLAYEEVSTLYHPMFYAIPPSFTTLTSWKRGNGKTWNVMECYLCTK